MLNDYRLFLNIGGIANISFNGNEKTIAFDVCPDNRVLNLLANEAGKTYDDGGQIAEKGTVNNDLLHILNELEYYQLPYPKSLSNDFGTDVIFPLIGQGNYGLDDALRTYVEHICQQVSKALAILINQYIQPGWNRKFLVTGGGAHNTFLVDQMRKVLQSLQVEVIVPYKELVDFKEALVMGLIGLLRWREENNVLSSVTGASRDSIGGAVWIGQEA
jgi:anhydro-N-acetylmuramic acid kinase